MMKLYYSPLSPFARKVRMTAAILGFAKQIELVNADVYNPAPEYIKKNPLVKIPALELNPNETLIESQLICEYLNDLSTSKKIIPAGGREKWSALMIHAIADGATDACLLRRYEALRTPDKQDAAWDARQKNKVQNALSELTRLHADYKNEWHIGTLAVISFLGYLDFRFANEKWPEQYPLLFNWCKDLESKNDFVSATKPA